MIRQGSRIVVLHVYFVISLLSNSVRFPVIDQPIKKNMYINILSCIFTSEKLEGNGVP